MEKEELMLQPIGSSPKPAPLAIAALLRSLQPGFQATTEAAAAAAAATTSATTAPGGQMPVPDFQTVLDNAQPPPQPAAAAGAPASAATVAAAPDSKAVQDPAALAAEKAKLVAAEARLAADQARLLADQTRLAADQAKLAAAALAAKDLASVIQAISKEVQAEADAALTAQFATLASTSSDPSQLFNGLPAATSATLMGGGWASPLVGSNPSMTTLIASFFYSLGAVLAVNASPAPDATGDSTQHQADAEAAREAYGHRQAHHHAMDEAVGADFAPKPAAVDIQD
jgi:hypothetical protein